MRTAILAFMATLVLVLVVATVAPRDEAEEFAAPREFKGCLTCHAIRGSDGTLLAGTGARTGPNLFGVVGARAASATGFRYRSGLERLGESGFVWSKESLIEYLQDPTGFLREILNDTSVRSAMVFRVKDAGDASAIVDYLSTFGPDRRSN